nr:uncharacterized protein LOC129254729 [Lytechinus pictus]
MAAKDDRYCTNDSDPPVVTCSNGRTHPFFSNSFYGLTLNNGYTTTDANPNPSGISYNVTIANKGDLFPPGYTPVTLYSTDICNNTATCLFSVFNPLTELPVDCPDLNRTVSTDPGQATYSFTPDFGADSVTKSSSGYRYHGDAVSVNITLGGYPVGGSVSIGTHEVIAIIFDDELEKKCTGIYTVEDYCLTDPDPPEVTCSNGRTHPFFSNSFYGLTLNNGYTTTDANPNPSGISYNVTVTNKGDLFPPGYTPVTLYSKDICNNTATCLFYVFNPLTELPVDCPDLNRTVSTDLGQATYSFTPDFGADNVTKSSFGYRYHGDAVSVNITLGGYPVGGSVSIGTHEVIAIIFDDELEKKCTGIYTVEDYCTNDSDPPVVTCSNGRTHPLFSNSFYGLALHTEYTTTDANPNPSGTSYNVTVTNKGDLFPPGYTPVTLYSKDICNNTATCLFYVFNPLTELPVDCPDLNRTVSTDLGQATYSFTPDFGADNVTKSSFGYRYHGDAVSVNITLGGYPVGGSVSIGTREVIAIIFDDELEKKCTGIYTVEGNMISLYFFKQTYTDPPIVTCSNATLPNDSPNTFHGLTNDMYTYYDASPYPNVTYDVTEGAPLAPGYTAVTMFAVDEYNNSAECLFYVQNTLTELPVNCPDLNRTVRTNPHQATYNFTPDFGADNVTKSVDGYRYHGDAVSVNITLGGFPVGGSVSIGTHGVIAIIFDDELEKKCTGIYTVEDTDPPIVTCSNVTLPNDSPNTFHGLTNDMYTYYDASPYPNVTYDVTEGAPLAPGYTAVTMFAVDEYNNSAECLFYVQNTLTELPVSCPDLNRTVRTNPHQATYNFTPDFGADNVTKSVDGYRYHGDAVSVNITLGGFPVGGSVSIGTHGVIAIIFDDELEKKCTGIYTVEDTDPPIVTCSNVTLPNDSPNTFHGLTNDMYTYYDASPYPNVTYDVTEGAPLAPGYTAVTMFAVDEYNNSAECLFYVQNTLTELPVNCPDLNRTVSTDPHQATYNFAPDFGADNVTKSVDGYRYHGDAVSVNITLGGYPVGGSVSIGTHEVVAIIFDDELEKKCTGIYIVEGNIILSLQHLLNINKDPLIIQAKKS